MTDHVLAIVYYDILIHKNIVEIIALMVERVFQFFFFIQKHEQIKLECVTFGAFSILTARKVCVISYFLVVKTSYTPRTKGDAVEWWRTNWEVSALIDGPPSLTGGRRRAASSRHALVLAYNIHTCIQQINNIYEICLRNVYAKLAVSLCSVLSNNKIYYILNHIQNLMWKHLITSNIYSLMNYL